MAGFFSSFGNKGMRSASKFDPKKEYAETYNFTREDGKLPHHVSHRVATKWVNHVKKDPALQKDNFRSLDFIENHLTPAEKKHSEGKAGFQKGFDKAAGMADLGKRMRSLQAYTESKAKSVAKNWTPDSPVPFNKVMEKEMPHVPNWKLKLQGARA